MPKNDPINNDNDVFVLAPDAQAVIDEPKPVPKTRFMGMDVMPVNAHAEDNQHVRCAQRITGFGLGMVTAGTAFNAPLTALGSALTMAGWFFDIRQQTIQNPSRVDFYPDEVVPCMAVGAMTGVALQGIAGAPVSVMALPLSACVATSAAVSTYFKGQKLVIEPNKEKKS